MPFLTPNVPAHFKTAVLRRSDLTTPQARCTFVIEPLPYALAQELGGEVADHLYDDLGHIRAELESVTLHPRVGLQRLVAKVVPDSDVGLAEIMPVALAQIKGTRVEDEKKHQVWIALALVVEFDLTSRKPREFILDRFDTTVLLTFTAIQPVLDAIRDFERDIPEGDSVTISAGGESATIYGQGREKG